VRDTFEKVCRLADILAFMERDPLLADCLALKGGTAINLTVFDLPRLSVDIDLDFINSVLREEMLAKRELITEHLQKFMVASGYTLNEKSKQYHALDSFVYDYVNAGGTKDNLKIEINYMLRCHVLPAVRGKGFMPWNENRIYVLCLNPLEIFAAKVVALLNRAAPRDLFDVFNMQKHSLLMEEEKDLFKKCVIFYAAIASDIAPKSFNLDNMIRISQQKIKTDLLPVLHRGEQFEVTTAQEQVHKYLTEILRPTDAELLFWEAFAEKRYKPELLFTEPDILERIENHPMALWKCNRNEHY